MLTSLKDKLLTVTKNVGLFNSEDTPNKVQEKAIVKAGSAILQRYQDSWCEMHCLNEENAKEAAAAATDIERISRNVKDSRENVGLINHILTNSTLTSNISQCLSQVKQLYLTCETLEQKLVNLEDLINEIEFENMKKQHRYHLDSYRIRKNEALQQTKNSLEEQYQIKIIEHEASKKSILQERQQVFQEAFKTDLETYKSLGTIPKVDLPKQQNGAILEEIQLDFDQNELEKFFEAENDNNVTL